MGSSNLSQPDPYSRSQEHEGRRIILLDEHRPWGWIIVNHEYYRDLASVEDRREKAKLRKQKQREKEGEKEDVTPCHTPSRMSRHTDTNTNTNTKKKTKRFTPPSLQEIIDYCKERKNSVNPNDFLNHYQANGWYRGKTKVKDWKACIRTWEKNRPDSNFEKGAI